MPDEGLLQVGLAGPSADLGPRGGPHQQRNPSPSAGEGRHQGLLLRAQRGPVQTEGHLSPAEAEPLQHPRQHSQQQGEGLPAPLGEEAIEPLLLVMMGHRSRKSPGQL